MSHDHLDLTPLDPTADEARFEQLVASISERAADQLARRRARSSAIAQLTLWKRPMLIAAAVIGIVSVTVLARTQSTAPLIEEPTGVAEAIGVPVQLAQWARSGQVPDPAELLVAVEGSL